MSSKPFDWNELAEWVDSPCLHCDDSSSSPADEHHTGMAVTRPGYVDSYLQELTGPGEQHRVDPASSCINPKCGYHFTPQDEQEIHRNKGWFTCPECGTEYNYLAQAPTYMHDDPDAWQSLSEAGAVGDRAANPGGMTRSGLTLGQMGDIGEKVVYRMHELPGIGTVTSIDQGYHFPIDATIQSQRGNFGVEIKTNHSESQERFKIGGKFERQEKIRYCLENGLKPALVGVRLNFFTDLAYIFFREGLTDTWIGNAQMIHVATVDFSDLNPFKSPDQQAQALAVTNANLPDQSDASDADLDETFGPVQKVAEAQVYTFKRSVHRLKVVDKKGKYTHDITRCQQCGHAVQRPPDHRDRFECPSCGGNPTKQLRAAKVVLTNPNVDDVAAQLGFTLAGRTGQGHRKYVMVDPFGTTHSVVVGSGKHGTDAALIDAQRGRQRMMRCLGGQCSHTHSKIVPQVDEPGAPVFHAGQTVPINDREYFIMEIDGGLALVLDTISGEEDVVPTVDLKR